MLPIEADRRRGFRRGLMLGFGLGLGFSFLCLAAVIGRGIVLHVPAAPLARALSVEAQAQLEESLPSLLGAARGRVPELVRPELKRRLATAKIEFYGVSIAVPPESLGGLETYLVGVVEQTVGRVLDGMARELTGEETATPLCEFLEKTLRQDLNGKMLRVSLPGGLTLPVTVQVE